MQRLAHWECRDCFKGMQSLHRRLQENWDNCHSKKTTNQEHLYGRNCCSIKGMSHLQIIFMHRISVIVILMASVVNVQISLSELKSLLSSKSTHECRLIETIFRWSPSVLNLTCQVFGKKQLFSVGLVLQKYTGLISLSAASPSSLCLVSYVNATSSGTSHKFASLITVFFSVWLISHILLLTGYTICRDM